MRLPGLEPQKGRVMRHPIEDFPFRIGDVQRLMGLQPVRIHSGNSDFNCIFCGGKGKMNINYVKNVYGCVKCGAGGGMVDLYASYYHLTAKAAYDEICQKLSFEESVERAKVPGSEDANSVVPESIRASEEEIHHTYSVLLSHLTLSQKHREDLLARGLTEEQIKREGYRSTPVFGVKKLAGTLQEMKCVVEGVPGFYQDKNGEWTINFHSRNSGFLIPVRTFDGKIQGMQIRTDHVVDDRKYVWFSSGGRRKGTSSGSPLHMIGRPAPEVYVTEGPLKGTIAHYLTGKTFLCVAGVMQYRKLPEALEALKQQGLVCVNEAYDMDKLIRCAVVPETCRTCKNQAECESYKGYRSLPEQIRIQVSEIRCQRLKVKRDNIQRGCMQLYRICNELSLPCHRMVWSLDENGEWNGTQKGIDDYYAALREERSGLWNN